MLVLVRHQETDFPDQEPTLTVSMAIVGGSAKADA